MTLHKVQDFWSMPVEDYLDAISSEAGWSLYAACHYVALVVIESIVLLLAAIRASAAFSPGFSS